jgi:hypothetical protein
MIKCAVQECGKEATKCPHLSIAAKVMPHGPRVPMVLALPLCEDHAIPDASKYVTDAGWQGIKHSFAELGRAEPDRKTMRVTFVSLQEARDFFGECPPSLIDQEG